MDTQVNSSVVQDSRSASERLNQECFCITLDREARASETMPTNACMFFYVCKGCGIRLKPRDVNRRQTVPLERTGPPR